MSPNFLRALALLSGLVERFQKPLKLIKNCDRVLDFVTEKHPFVTEKQGFVTEKTPLKRPFVKNFSDLNPEREVSLQGIRMTTFEVSKPY